VADQRAWASAADRLSGAHKSVVCQGRGARWPLDLRPMALVPRTARTLIHESGPSDQSRTEGARGLYLLWSARGGAIRTHDGAAAGDEVDWGFWGARGQSGLLERLGMSRRTLRRGQDGVNVAEAARRRRG
jgi:hypothetical protein